MMVQNDNGPKCIKEYKLQEEEDPLDPLQKRLAQLELSKLCCKVPI